MDIVMSPAVEVGAGVEVGSVVGVVVGPCAFGS
ncbi:hypothetical protein JOD67_002664 [Tenggerimyces flavus]|nr:hypothetical protein [Tenggerimyces flavus]